jgi:DNA polymerase-1
LIEDIRKKKHVCFDTETTGLDTSNSELVGMSFAMTAGEAFYVPLPINYEEATKIVNEFKPVFEDEEISKTGQNMKFDISMLKWYDVEVKGKLFDTMLAHYLIEPDQRHGMDFLSETYLGYKPISFDELTGKKAGKQPDMRQVQETRLNEVVNYAAEDADITLQLREKLEPFLTENKTLPLFEEIEMPLVPVLASMEAEGVKLDVKALNDYSAQLLEEIIIVEKEIYDLAGGEFNISSPKQLGVILFDRLKIADNPKKTKTKQYSTGEDILSKLEKRHPIVSKILDYRSLTKLKSTYVDALPLLVNPRDGRIHTSYNQAVAATGRLSSTNPNLQNIPIRTEKGREIRKSFVPRSDEFTLLSADYSQIELRIIAELSEDPAMMEAFRSGLDIHTATAAKVYGVELDEITKDMRRNAKAVNFGIVYGISAFGLSEQLNIPRSEAHEMIANYFEEYAGVKKFMDQTIRFARENGFVTTIKGRRRYLRDINSGNATVRGFAERNAINAPIQGSSADMIKIAMINIHNEIIRRKLNTRMILQVHDELVFDVFKDELDEIKILVEDKMKHAIEMKVPVLVDMNNGNTWLEAH